MGLGTEVLFLKQAEYWRCLVSRTAVGSYQWTGYSFSVSDFNVTGGKVSHISTATNQMISEVAIRYCIMTNYVPSVSSNDLSPARTAF